MDNEKLKSRIREALGAAGIPREVAAQVEGIIDAEGGGKKAEKAEKPAPAHRAEPPPRTHREEKDEDEPRLAPAKMAVKPARKTKAPARKKK